jgi:hypothetical protein
MTETEVRQTIREMGAIAIRLTTLTNNQVDDQIVNMFFQAIDNNLVWQFLWPMIDGFFTENKVMESPDYDDACAAMMINPILIWNIITTIKSLWELFKKV